MLFNIRQIGFLHDMHAYEHSKYCSSLIDHIKADVMSIPELVEVWEEFEPLVEHENLIVRASKESIETQAIATDDKRRDLTFREIRRLLKYYSKLDDLPINADAKDLLFLMRHYDGTERQNLFSEMAYINKFLNEFNSSEQAAKVNAIPGLREMINYLTSTNDRFEELYNQRMIALERLNSLGKRVNIRKDVDKALINLLSTINVIYRYNELSSKDPAIKEKLEGVANKVNALHEQLLQIMAQRKGWRKRRKAEAQKDAPATK
ncbi:MAG: DUF6261 family protein [Tannerellaceae bacterium]|jgi:hypothetical protein|nr:DUF6261 family protein [Tannerellaceae bacterium]